MPKVTVLMPVYNGEKYLREAIDSILNQTFRDFEFLIIDDGSSDRSLEIINSYQDHRISLVRNETNLGLITTLNKGLSLARGEYIARMDCDDISFCDRLEKQVAYLDAHPEISLLGTNAQIINVENIQQEICESVTGNNYIKWRMLFGCPFIHPTVMMRKKSVDLVNGYECSGIEIINKANNYCEDYNLWRKVINKFQADNLPEVLLYLRKHESNVSNLFLEQQIYNGAVVNNLIIKNYIDVDISVTQRIFSTNWRRTEIKSFSQVCSQIFIIVRLYQKFTTTNSLPKSELIKINEDTYHYIASSVESYFKKIKKIYCFIIILVLAPQVAITRLVYKIYNHQ
ncbi:MAG: glycosyltransferase [Pseudanabaenaceae cyanobacterium bins.39]|nr:glycosyltransferase [Pseudanabaenaceae cyanobacterium bins.39]